MTRGNMKAWTRIVFACACGLVAAARAETIKLPVTEVREVADFQERAYPGRVVPIAQVNVVPQVSGEILEVAFENGALVKAGDLLYRLDPVKYEAAVKNAEAKVAECKSSAGYAELSYTRHLKLVESRAVSQDAVDNALSARDSARAALAAANADLTVARDNLKHCRITAPISGQIGTTAFTRGNYVTTSSGTLVTLIQMKPIRVRFAISNREYLDLFNGSERRFIEEGKIVLTLANGSEFGEDGQIEYVENAADELTDTVMAYAIFPNAERKLKTGGTVTVTLTSRKGVMRPAIPPTAVLQDTQGPYVWVVGAGGAVERRYIARGDLQGDVMFVEKGLKPGERIVAVGGHKVTKGMTVEPAK